MVFVTYVSPARTPWARYLLFGCSMMCALRNVLVNDCKIVRYLAALLMSTIASHVEMSRLDVASGIRTR